METVQSEYSTINDFRAYLESNYQTNNCAYTFFSNITSKNESVLREIGYNRFLLNSRFDSVWSSTNLDEQTKKDLIDYCIQRLDETQKAHLAARYNFALLIITKNNRYAYGAIKSYKSVADFYLKESNNDPSIVFEFVDTAKELLLLYTSYKKDNISELTGYFKDILNQNYPLKLKIGLLRIFSEEKIFKPIEINNLTSLCLDIYNTINDDNWRERVLEIGLTLSQKTQNNREIVIFAELLGDWTLKDIHEYDDKNIAISHLNEITYEKAIKYYKLAKNNEKVSATTIKLEENRTRHQYLRIPIYSKSANYGEFIDCINKLVEEEINKSFLMIILPICKHNHSALLINYDKLKALLNKDGADYFYKSSFEAVRVDKWGNKHHTTHESIAMHDSFHLMYQRSTLLYVPLLLCNCMKTKKINIRQFRTALRKAGFFISISVKRAGADVEIPLYDIVGKGLEDYVKQNNKLFSDKSKADWRFCIDFLTPKFESIIRCIASTIGIPVVKTTRDGEVQFVTLEKILAEPKLKDIFNDDDIFLFNHTFTKEGLNIRNEVAHGLLLPQDYTSEIALLVFLSVLRLSKIVDYIIKQKDSQSEI